VEECTYFWGVNTSWGINMDERKRPINQEDNQAPQPTWPSGVIVQHILFSPGVISPEFDDLSKRVSHKSTVANHFGSSSFERFNLSTFALSQSDYTQSR
jgi:hypothetical protein